MDDQKEGWTHRFKNEQEFLKFLKWQQKEQTTPAKELEGKEDDLIKTAQEACMLIIGAYEGYQWERARSLEATASQMFEYAKAGYATNTPNKSNEAIEFGNHLKDNWTCNSMGQWFKYSDPYDRKTTEQVYNLFSPNEQKNKFMNVSQIKIEHTTVNSGNCTFTTTMPTAVANWIMEQVIGWEEKWLLTPKMHNEFIENDKIFATQKTPNEQGERK